MESGGHLSAWAPKIGDMKRLLAAATIVATLAAGGSATAAQSAPNCKQIAQTSTTQTRDLTGVIVAPGTRASWTEQRTVTITTSRCRGERRTVTTATPWERV